MFDRLWHQLLRRPYRLHVAKYGDPALPPLILLHGIGADGNDWRHFLPLLSTSYHCITIDLLGHGRSPKPQWCEYYPADHIASLRRTIRHLGLQNYVLMGHSLGSLLSTKYASLYPENIDRLILLSPPIYPPVDHIRSHIARRRTNVLLALYRSTRRSFVTPELISRFAFIFPPARSIKQDSEGWVPALKTLEHCIEQQTILEDIKAVHMPLDAWYGMLDEVVIGTNVQLLRSRQPHIRIHTYGGRHVLTKQYATVFTAWLFKQKI